MSTLGPLTTTFTPSPSCASYTGYTEFVNQKGSSYLVKGPVTTDGCYPSGYKTETDYYYTPGQCPSGYTVACASLLDAKTVAVTTGYCCPILEKGVFQCFSKSRNSTNAFPTTFPCVQVITNTTTLLPLTRVSDGSTLSTFTSTITTATVGAYGVQIQYSENDKLEGPPDPERFNQARLAFHGQNVAHDHGLSPEMKVGAGVGACFAAGLIGLGVLIFLRRKRTLRHGNVKNDDTVIFTPVVPTSIRRKPVPSVHSSELSSGTRGHTGYCEVSTSEVQNHSHKGIARGQGHRRQLFDGISLWAWEIMSLFASVLSLVSIVIILDVYEDRQLQEWTPRVSINAVISVLSAVFKGSLALPVTEGISQLKWLMLAQQPRALSDLAVYDKASRGAWGSAMMIFGQFKTGSRAYLASFGAALAILVLATDPFAQATISLYSCTRNGTEIASIPRANNYTVSKDKYNPVVLGAFNIAMQLASYRGVLEPPANSSASVSVSCTTGNCTFPEDGGAAFTTLTMCSQTWDITDRVRAQDSKSGYIYSLNSDLSVRQGSTFNMSYVSVPDTSFKESNDNPWNRTSVLDVYILSMVEDNSADCKPPLCTPFSIYSTNFRPAAFVFSLLPCVQTFSASLVHGRYSEKVMSEEYLHYASLKYQLLMNRTMTNGTWEKCTSTNKPNETNTIPVLLGPDSLATQSPVWSSPECVFEFYGGNYLGSFLGSTFFTPTQLAALTAWKSQLWRNASTDIDLVTKFANGLATSIGAQMRTSATGPDMLREARGTTLVEKTCIRIHWGYISFLAAMFVLEVLFLCAVMVMGSRSRLYADWKSSTLAVAFLSAGASQGGGWPADNPESEDSLQEAARSINVSINDDYGHWRLRTEGKF